MARFTLVDQCVQYVREATGAYDRFVRSEAAMVVLATALPRLGMSGGAVTTFIRIVTHDIFVRLLAEDVEFDRQTELAVAASYNVAQMVVELPPGGGSGTGGAAATGDDDLDGFEMEFARSVALRQARRRKRKRRERARAIVRRRIKLLKTSMQQLTTLDPSLRPYLREEMAHLDVMNARMDSDSSSSSDD